MIRLLRVTIRNFQSFGNVPTTVELDTHLTTLILGRNKDVGEDGDSRNAAGKSVLFNAIFWCMFDEGIDETKQDEHINLFNGKHMEVKLEFEVDGLTYQLTRGRKPNRVELLQNGNPVTMHGTRNTDESIHYLFKTNAVIFRNTYLMDANSEPFMKMKAAVQRDFMENFLDLNLLTVRAKALKHIRDENKVAITLEENNLANQRNNNDRARNQIATLSSKIVEWDNTRRREIDELSANIGKLEAIDIPENLGIHGRHEADLELISKYEKEYATYDHRLEVLNTKLTALDKEEQSLVFVKQAADKWDQDQVEHLSKLHTEEAGLKAQGFDYLVPIHEHAARLNDELKVKQGEIAKLEPKLEAVSKELTDLERQRTTLLDGKCPYCAGPLHDKSKLSKVEETHANRTTIRQSIETQLETALNQEENIQKAIAETQSSLAGKPTLKECNAGLSRLETLALLIINAQKPNPNRVLVEHKQQALSTLQAENSREKLTNEIDKVVNDATQVAELLESSKKSLTSVAGIPSRMELDRIVQKLEASRAQKIALENNRKNPYQEQVDVLTASISEPDESKLLSLKTEQEHCDILIKLLTDSKSFVRKNIIDNYVPFLNTKINAYLERVDSAHTVKMNPDLTTELYYSDFPVSYASCSKGEKLRLNFSTSMAFRDLASTFGKNFNAMFIDEFFDAGSDPGFFKKVFAIIDKEDKSVFIISHRDELKALADVEVTAVKERGFTTLEFAA